MKYYLQNREKPPLSSLPRDGGDVRGGSLTPFGYGSAALDLALLIYLYNVSPTDPSLEKRIDGLDIVKRNPTRRSGAE